MQTNTWITRLLLVFLALTAPCNAQEKRNLSTVREPETIQFQSKLVGATLPYAIILPTDYSRARATRYPVLYLLHGLTGHYSDWIRRTNVADYAAQYRLIVVMPEGNDGWYTDSAGVPNDKYESYILQELIPDVQHRFRTIEAGYARAIAGLSMGGYSSIKFGLKHPTTFAFAGSMSGAFGVTRDSEKESGWKGLTEVFRSDQQRDSTPQRSL
jgi:putative tributyrin esterase